MAWLYLLVGHGRLLDGATLGRERGAVPASAFLARSRWSFRLATRADVIGEAVRRSCGKVAPSAIHIFLVDDDSSDGTAEVARGAAASSSHPDALTIIPGQPLPDGWTGKLWAMQQGIEQALPLHPQFLLLTDADILHSPESIATLDCYRREWQATT